MHGDVDRSELRELDRRSGCGFEVTLLVVDAHEDRPRSPALMFTYQVHQAADILFCDANVVPVGKDQLSHVELTRTIARPSTSATPSSDRTSPSPRPC